MLAGESVDEDFFEQGQALQQVPRHSVIAVAIDALKVKLIRCVVGQLVLESFFAVWIAGYLLSMTSEGATQHDFDSHHFDSNDVTFSVIFLFVCLVPDVAFKIYLLLEKPRLFMPTLQYKRAYIASNYYLLVAALTCWFL